MIVLLARGQVLSDKGIWSCMKMSCDGGKLNDALARLGLLHQQDPELFPDACCQLVQACTNMKDLVRGRQVHAHIITIGFVPGILLLNNLINMYTKCGSMANAHQLFNGGFKKDVFTWTTMIAGYARHQETKEVINLFREMLEYGLMPNNVTYVSFLSACTNVLTLTWGKYVHAKVMKARVISDICVGNSLIGMYGKCGNIRDAGQVFESMPAHDIISWNAMIHCWSQFGEVNEVFSMFKQVLQHGLNVNKATYRCILSACASGGALDWGKCVHAQLVTSDVEVDLFLGSSLIDMYVKCRSIKDAQQIFGIMPAQDVVSYTSMICGYAEGGDGNAALMIYEKMQQCGLDPDKVAYASVLSACASIGALESGRHVHFQVTESGNEFNILVGNALINMYAKCGSILNARQVFDQMPLKDTVSWSSIISGYADHGDGNETIKLFEKMQLLMFKPDKITFLSMLVAFSHIGLVDEGLECFNSMSHLHAFEPTSEHCACMVDLLGRAGQLGEARNLIDTMPCEPDLIIWRAFLSACAIYGDTGSAECAMEAVMKLDHPNLAAAVVLLANTYGASRRLNADDSG